MGRRYHLLADGPTGTGADRENHAVRSRYRASDKGATGVCQLGSFGVASAGLPSPAMPFRRTPAEPHYYLGAGDVGREREDCRRHVPLHAGLHLAGNGREEWQLQPGGNVRSSGQGGNSHSRSGGNGEMAEKSALLADICKRVVVSDMLERLATDEQRSQGLDIADFFLTVPTQRQILQQMIRRNPALQLLIDELDLELIE